MTMRWTWSDEFWSSNKALFITGSGLFVFLGWSRTDRASAWKFGSHILTRAIFTWFIYTLYSVSYRWVGADFWNVPQLLANQRRVEPLYCCSVLVGTKPSMLCIIYSSICIVAHLSVGLIYDKTTEYSLRKLNIFRSYQMIKSLWTLD